MNKDDVNLLMLNIIRHESAGSSGSWVSFLLSLLSYRGIGHKTVVSLMTGQADHIPEAIQTEAKRYGLLPENIPIGFDQATEFLTSDAFLTKAREQYPQAVEAYERCKSGEDTEYTTLVDSFKNKLQPMQRICLQNCRVEASVNLQRKVSINYVWGNCRKYHTKCISICGKDMESPFILVMRFLDILGTNIPRRRRTMIFG